MKRLGAGFLVSGVLGLVACGGRVIAEPGSGGVETPVPTTGGANGSAGGSGTTNHGKVGSLPTTQLGQCSPGFSRSENPTRSCHWLTEDGMCFDDSNAACACICPTQGDSICSHGFDDGPNSATLVFCN